MNKKKKIGLVVSQSPIYTETFIQSKIDGLIQSGYEVVLFSNLNSDNQTSAKLVVSYMGYSRLRLLLYAPVLVFKAFIYIKKILNYWRLNTAHSGINKLKNLFSNLHILTNPVDCLHFEFTILAVEREMVAKSIGAVMSVSFRGYDISLSPLTKPRCYNLAWESIDAVHSISNDLVNRAYKLGLKKKTPVSLITPAIILDNFNIADVNWETPFQFCTTGRVSWKKGYQYVFEALYILKSKQLQFHYHIIGGFEPEEEERFKYLVIYYGLENEVTFHNKLSPSKVNDILNKVHVYIQYSIQEGFCNSALEAQAKGLMVIVSDAGGLPENVIDNETGWVVEAANPVKLAEKIGYVVNLPSEVKSQISAKAIARIKNEFGLEMQKDKFKKFFA